MREAGFSVHFAALESSSSAISVGGSTSSKKRTREKEQAKEAVHARYLMEKYGSRWRMKTTFGMKVNVFVYDVHLQWFGFGL
jgi:hypothetical protein